MVIIDYGETFQAALKVGPKWCRRRIAAHGKAIINFLICILQPGFCAPYIVFIAQNIKVTGLRIGSIFMVISAMMNSF